MKNWVSNTSPLIFLAHLDRLEILREFSPKLLIPEAVYTEITIKVDSATEKIQKACEDWIGVVPIQDKKKRTLALADLHIGEAEAIVLAQEKNAPRLVIDDQDARRFALRCGLKIIGTLGILLAGKKRGLIQTIQPEIEKLLAINFRIKENLIKALLKEAGE